MKIKEVMKINIIVGKVKLLDKLLMNITDNSEIGRNNL